MLYETKKYNAGPQQARTVLTPTYSDICHVLLCSNKAWTHFCIFDQSIRYIQNGNFKLKFTIEVKRVVRKGLLNHTPPT